MRDVLLVSSDVKVQCELDGKVRLLKLYIGEGGVDGALGAF